MDGDDDDGGVGGGGGGGGKDLAAIAWRQLGSRLGRHLSQLQRGGNYTRTGDPE